MHEKWYESKFNGALKKPKTKVQEEKSMIIEITSGAMHIK